MQIKNVIIINDFNYVQGGASKVAIQTAKLLKNKGFNVFFFSAVNKEGDNIEGITYISTFQNEALKEKNKIKGIVNGIYNFYSRKKLKQLLKKFNNEDTIVHIHGWTKALSSSVFDIAFKMKFKVVLTTHDYFTACPNGGYFNYKMNDICYLKPLSFKCLKCNCDSRNYGFKLYRIIRQIVQNKIVNINKKIKYVVGISDLNIKVLEKTLNSNVKIKKIYNPVELKCIDYKIDFLKNQFYLYVGRVCKEKGVEIFCKAIDKLNLKGVVVGDGDEKKRLEKEYPTIDFVGWKNNDEITEYMKNAKALIFPSLWYEGAPLTPIEAKSIGLPCIVSNCSSATEYESSKDLIFNPKEENSLEECILKLENYEIIVNNKNNDVVCEILRNEYIENLISFYEEE